MDTVDHDGLDLSGTTARRVDLSSARAEDVRLRDAELRSADLSGMVLRDVLLRDVRVRGAYVESLELSGEIGRLVVNGVDVAPLVLAELDRTAPGHADLRPTDADGFRHAWAVLEDLWAGTLERARSLDAALLHERVDGEWSFVDTLRHLAFATECWLLRAVQGDPAPWHPLSLPWEEAPPTPAFTADRDARPDLDTALALRRDRADRVRAHLATLTDDDLAGRTVPVRAPGWPEPESFPVRECLLTILTEEWWHRRYAERDLAVLTAR
ncbi:DinB family protein [Arthrobacter sp. NEB 688]|uniref:DinB family protein n=1 Tax=Arthrobacter sp. NEB 688 TaxID=904039 RepID=UPI00156400F2|nr:DinB family protein [Arthrobacter sp. NEB 688]QKE84934.1 DinB family protein [Arthrobacter sp. NEB 688]